MRNFYFTFILWILLGQTQAQTLFQKLYDAGLQDEIVGMALQPNNDVFVAATLADGNNASDAAIFRTDDKGDLLWAKKFDEFDLGSNMIGMAQNTSNEMVVLLSEVTTVPNRYILAKLNANGDIIWGSRIQQPLTLNSISATDNGYLICGQTTTDDAILIKVSETGSIAWSTVVNDSKDLNLLNAWTDAGGLIYASGWRIGSNFNEFDALLCQFSPSGSLIWSRAVSSSGNEIASTVVGFAGTDDIWWGGFTDALSVDEEAWILLTNTQGETRWSKSYGATSLRAGITNMAKSAAAQTVFTIGDIHNTLASPALLAKVNNLGNVVLNQQFLTGAEFDFINTLQLGAGNQVLLGGQSRINGNPQGMLIRTNQEAASAVDCCPKSLNLKVRDVTMQNTLFTPQTASGGSNTTATPLNTATLTPQVIQVCKPLEVDFTISDSTACPGECVEVTFLKPTADAIYSSVVTGGSADAPPSKCFRLTESEMRITYTAKNGVCTESLTKTIKTKSDKDLIPNAFTPNGDMNNDVFMPIFGCSVSGVRFQVFNRWGKLVFETTNPDAGWDGKIEGADAPTDVYGWQLDYEVTVNGTAQKRNMKGEVTLVR